MNKKTTGILLVFILAIGMTLSGCGSSAPKTSETEPATEAVTEAATEAATEAVTEAVPEEQTTLQDTEEEQESIEEPDTEAAAESQEEDGEESTEAAPESQEEDEEESTEAAPEAQEDGVTTLTGFTSGVLIDEEDGDYCEIISMGMAEDGYLIEYKGLASGDRGESYVDIENPVVNGLSYIPLLWPDVDSSKYDDATGSEFLFIPRQWLEKYGIDEVKSLCFQVELGRINSSSFEVTCKQEFTIYPQEEYTSPYEPVLPDTAKVLYETDDFQLLLVDSTVTEDDDYYNQELEFLCLRKSDFVTGYVNAYGVVFDDVMIDLSSRVPNSALGRTVAMDIWRGANAAYMIYTWKSLKEYCDLSNAKIRFSYSIGNGMEASYMDDKVDIDLTQYLK